MRSATQEATTPFLTAEWRHLAMLNYAIDPALLAPLVPPGTQLDFDRGETFVSVVGFLFLDTRLRGVPIPFHRNFEEVNLRFYVKREHPNGERRGVAFVRELVPRRAIALIARAFYREPYSALPMRHEIQITGERSSVKFSWRRSGTWEYLAISGAGEARPSEPGSHEEFITEHYYGYTARGVRSSEYRIAHPRWKITTAAAHELRAEIATLYGEQFVAPLGASPVSAFIAEGSRVEVYPRTREWLQSP